MSDGDYLRALLAKEGAISDDACAAGVRALVGTRPAKLAVHRLLDLYNTSKISNASFSTGLSALDPGRTATVCRLLDRHNAGKISDATLDAWLLLLDDKKTIRSIFAKCSRVCLCMILEYSTIEDIVALHAVSWGDRRDTTNLKLTLHPPDNLADLFRRAPLRVAEFIRSLQWRGSPPTIGWTKVDDAWEELHPAYDLVGAISIACKLGWFEKLQWMSTQFEIDADMVCGADSTMIDDDERLLLCDEDGNPIGGLCEAAAHGHFAIVQWLIARFDLASNESPADYHKALEYACRFGHLTTAIWISSQFDFNRDCTENKDSAYSICLGSACAHGWLDLAVWLVHRFKLTSCDVFKGRALTLACVYNHFEMASWLVFRFNLMSNVHACDSCHAQCPRECVYVSNAALCTMCKEGHTQMVQWIVPQLGLPVGEALSHASLASGGGLELSMWLITHFNLIGTS